MFLKSLLSVFITFLFINGSPQKINKVEMKLSAFGVESGRMPNIEAVIDFEKRTSVCSVSYYSDYKSFKYSLTKEEIDKVQKLLEKTNLDKLKKNYAVAATDQLTSTTKIYADHKTYTIKDYGLKSEESLRELYELVYKWDKTVK